MTACYAKDRRAAIEKLGNRYDCCCHPEIMNAFVYGLNDSDERVRAEAADEIGDQLRKNRCCCSPCLVSALTCALADCDRKVRRQAEEALEACGYEVVDGCCGGCADSCGAGACCGNGCGAAGCGATPVAAPAHAAPAAPEAVPAPAPPEEPQAYFPSRLHNTQPKTRSSLAGLFGLVR
ncbi:MAG: HEAT repeat domain-containing protein [Planctomycetaceae bacterium]|nr:HEAT repeat domain-containing protein [Planctomycetaceae bacterium]